MILFYYPRRRISTYLFRFLSAPSFYNAKSFCTTKACSGEQAFVRIKGRNLFSV
ncbi:hypothetical protein HMPREF3293_02931 [Christensenella minuta]|uniref:Uncharacterized protein n=1 Tax=Christensenella minuta TaxID=626937 RepID=A0A136Q0S2_9FIRM|nr:hypothetical protein HMPREF3293_02931 [Christensenella minuta]